MAHIEPQVKKPADPSMVDKLKKYVADKVASNITGTKPSSPPVSGSRVAASSTPSSVQPKQQPASESSNPASVQAKQKSSVFSKSSKPATVSSTPSSVQSKQQPGSASSTSPTAPTSRLGQGQWDEKKKKGDVKKHLTKVGDENVGATAHAGAESNRFRAREGDQVEIGAELRAEAGAEVHATGEIGDKQGLHAEGSAKAKTKADGILGARGGAGVMRDKKGKPVAAYARGEAVARAEAEAKAKAKGQVAYGDNVAVKGEAEVHAEAIADAHIRGSAAISDRGAAVSGDVGAVVKLAAGAQLSAAVDVGELEIQTTGSVDAEVLVGAEASGTFVIAANGVNLEYNVGAMAGADASAKGAVSASLSGREFVAAEGQAGVTVGYVVGAKGRFQVKGGKIVLNMGLAAPAVIPVGVSTEGTGKMNLNPLANLIAGGVADVLWQLDMDADKIIADPSGPKAALIKDLTKYSERKIKNLATDPGTEHYANRDTVQKYVKQRFPTDALAKKGVDSTACDKAIAEAIKASIQAKPGQQLEVTVVKGKVKEIKNMREPRAESDEDMSMPPSVEVDI